MPTWLKKIVLDIMPSVAATIIGAYVVNYYIIPKSPVGASRASISGIDSKPVASGLADDKVETEKPLVEKASFEKGVAEKTEIEKTAEKAASEKTETRKQTAVPKSSAKSGSAAADSAPSADVRRANDLARAAIDRLRGNSHSELAKGDVAKVQDAPRVQPVSTVASVVASPTVIPPMQPLPPAINVTTPNPDVFEQGNAPPVMRQPYPQAASRLDEPRRFAPPADIPGSRPLDLRAQALAMPTERTSIADDVMSTAKSVFRAVLPR